MDSRWIYVFVLICSIERSDCFHFNNSYTDPLTHEEYEEDVELIKIRFDATRPCRFFCKLFPIELLC